ncbi:WD40/YVTN/BNR-like repeat-containing protein [Pseudoduganella armeniaca]|uniref:Glycosyl hydrolase n=1 Tax=Pseudoduganella armeniaca TaxID=2072590 RepID=A0A2R4CA02_9BURK|nr:hypothetical protein [Pseudoduganella armeniaca]AVR96469.1 hypothetical protein C9I28_12745 [Pseudoduganella armeniaca]
MLLALAGAAMGQARADDFRLGNLTVTERDDGLLVRADDTVTLVALGSGRYWPPLVLDSAGRIHAGTAVIDAASGRVVRHAGVTLALPHGVSVTVRGRGYRIRRGNASCTVRPAALGLAGSKTAAAALHDGNVKFVPSAAGLVALASWLGWDTRETRYTATAIDIERCQLRAAPLGNPDLLVELNHSPGAGWWITGSIEQTLLRSRDGRHWRPVPLPQGLSSLVSSYLVDDNHIWLAAIHDADLERDPLLVYSADGGRHWRNLPPGDPLLARVPVGWLEGQRRLPQR